MTLNTPLLIQAKINIQLEAAQRSQLGNARHKIPKESLTEISQLIHKTFNAWFWPRSKTGTIPLSNPKKTRGEWLFLDKKNHKVILFPRRNSPHPLIADPHISNEKIPATFVIIIEKIEGALEARPGLCLFPERAPKLSGQHLYLKYKSKFPSALDSDLPCATLTIEQQGAAQTPPKGAVIYPVKTNYLFIGKEELKKEQKRLRKAITTRRLFDRHSEEQKERTPRRCSAERINPEHASRFRSSARALHGSDALHDEEKSKEVSCILM